MSGQQDGETSDRKDGTNIRYAMVLNTQLEQIPQLKQMISQLEGTRIIYQRSSVGYLRIVEVP